MPAQRSITVFMRRKPTAAALAAAKQAGAAAPPATPMGSFNLPFTTVDGSLADAKAAAAPKLKVDPRTLLVNIGPASESKGVTTYQISVLAPAQES